MRRGGGPSLWQTLAVASAGAFVAARFAAMTARKGNNVEAAPISLTEAQGPAPSAGILRAIQTTRERLGAAPMAVALFLAVFGTFYARALTRVAIQSDSAMHVSFMRVIAETGRLPRHLPHLAAVVDVGGDIRAWLPYQYTQLYHLLGAGLYKLGGESAVLVISPLFGAVLAVTVFRLTATSIPWGFAALGVLVALLSRTAIGVLSWVFMEPMVLALFFGGLWFYRRLWTEGGWQNAVIAGALFGLAISSRQSALAYFAFVCVHATISGCWEALRAERKWRAAGIAASRYGLMMLVGLISAAPALAYLAWDTGSIGYGSVAMPWLPPELPIDDAASGYISSISTPEGSPLDWLYRFHRTLLPLSDDLPKLLWFEPYLLFLAGFAFLVSRNDRRHSFLATYAVVHILGELSIYLTVHGNARYVLASRFTFYPLVATGAYVVFNGFKASFPRRPLVGGLVGTMALAVLAPAFANASFLRDLWSFDGAAADRGRAYEAAGVWVKANTPEDSLFLSARTYGSALHFERNVTWVTDFGNLWAVEAAYEKDPARARDILESYGVDYVVMQNPPGNYIDRMPRDGLRHIVLADTDHFQRVYFNDGIRIYRFWPEGTANQVRGHDE